MRSDMRAVGLCLLQQKRSRSLVNLRLASGLIKAVAVGGTSELVEGMASTAVLDVDGSAREIWGGGSWFGVCALDAER